MIARVVAVGLLLGIPLAVIAWWWVADNARQDLDGRIKAIADQLIRQEGEAGSIRPGTLDVDAFGVLLPDGGRLTIHYPVRSSVASPGQPERFAHVVVGAGVETDDEVDLVGACGEHQHGQPGPRRPDTPAHLQTVDLGQPQIEDQQFIPAVLRVF